MVVGQQPAADVENHNRSVEHVRLTVEGQPGVAANTENLTRSKQPHSGVAGHSKLRPSQTSTYAWLAAIICALLWVAIILGGLAVLIVYLVFRPRSPRVDVPSATLNAAYIDTDPDLGPLLNADVTLLANMSNPNEKVDVRFGFVEMDLYFRGVLVATQAVEGFAERRGETALRSVDLVASQVAMTAEAVEEWRRGVNDSRVIMEVRSRLRTTSELAGFLRFSYWLHGRCFIALASPPAGALLDRSCRTKR